MYVNKKESPQNMDTLTFKGFPLYDWEKIMRRHDIMIECERYSSNWSYLSRIFFFLFADNIDIQIHRGTTNSKIIFYQSYVERASSRKMMQSVKSLVDSDLLSYNLKRKIHIHINLGFDLLFNYLPYWYRQLNGHKSSESHRLVYLLELIKLFILKRRLDKLINTKKYNLYVSYCDAIVEEAFASQYFKKKGTVTASLQHGAFSAWRENELINSGVELRSFNSDYLLCWNQMTVDEGVKAGIPENKMKVLGIIGYINSDTEDWLRPNNKTFGVVIGHESFEEENLKLIETANIIAAAKDYHYYLKLHPNYNENHFDDKVDRKYYLGNVIKGISILEYANMVDFSIVGSSSVFVELVYINHDVIRYSTREVTDKFKDVRIGKVITSPEEILIYFDGSIPQSSKNDDFEKLFNYLCGYKDVKSRYIDFFDSYC